ncbi:aspartate aminotransferase family protein [Frankia sp. R82]|uniref:pyridoxal phosphate-dependent decarboxylase family protein n=1 Tax=Frankia sp. R82 TaxID=2950553 RepID=UPI002043B450|nr:pyridoxal-dependent decarboxylase [Frankia sp. R82]MCM3885598.1 pyridoxal-dependent decarboxylase [Frankia sp. R82]
MSSPAGPPPALADLVQLCLSALADGHRRRGGPLPAGGPARVRADILAALGASPDRAGHRPAWAGLLTADGIGATAALTELVTALAAGSAAPADPWCAAHLHCPPLAVAVAADLAVSALNPSLDSWDQAPAAATVETEVIAALAALVGFDPQHATGTITTGGSESNLLGLLLARDATPDGPTLRVFRSSAAHLSVDRAAAVLGLGSGPNPRGAHRPHDLSVVEIATDERDRMRVDLLRQALADHDGPAVVVATAGTTDAGAIDPLPQIAAVLEEHRRRPWSSTGRTHRPNGPGRPTARGWLHVDAAYGGGALFSARLAGLLTGLTSADSVALDLHKWGWQPAPAGVFLTPRPDGWPSLRAAHADYLRADDDEAAGYPSLLDRSLRTTRRPDSFPIAVTLRALGRRGLGTRVDACHELALHAEREVQADPRLELARPVTLSTLVFRYRPATPTSVEVEPAGLDPAGFDPAGPNGLDQVNAQIRRTLLQAGRAVVGRTRAGPEQAVHLKLTLLNPDASRADVTALLHLIATTGDLLAHTGQVTDEELPHRGIAS